ncbi:MAG: TolC family protein [Bdellovibrionales bacterium]|nr:TolC family protein [Bdellovibrionales bacterium]
MKKFIILGSVIFVSAIPARAETLSFASAWSKISERSAAQESSRLQTESLTEAQSRASRHWLPKVYIDARTYQTNDPGASFIGVLEQRSIKQADFSPDSINYPDTQLFTRGALGVDLALYEGGMKSSQVELFKHSVAAQKIAASQIQVEEYSTVGLSYGSIAVLEQQKIKLQALASEIERMINGYQLGSKSNPVGYSGLLGMKSLANRLSGLIKEYEAQSRSHYAALSEMGLKGQNWSPESIDTYAFVNRYFFDFSHQGESISSYRIESAKESVKASEQMANMEKAKFLPRAGVFAEAFVFNGNRDTANGYSAGLYLQWSLYDPSSYGSLREAQLKSMAAAKYSEASDQQERAERAALNESLESLRQNIELLNDSHNLLVEQSKMTETLFRNGSINALQIVEILSRRSDLIAQQGEAELGLIKAGSQIITKQKFDIGMHLGSGVRNEK